jgi:hypothetical protein
MLSDSSREICLFRPDAPNLHYPPHPTGVFSFRSTEDRPPTQRRLTRRVAQQQRSTHTYTPHEVVYLASPRGLYSTSRGPVSKPGILHVSQTNIPALPSPTAAPENKIQLRNSHDTFPSRPLSYPFQAPTSSLSFLHNSVPLTHEPRPSTATIGSS